jgi:hypothetical protein
MVGSMVGLVTDSIQREQEIVRDQGLVQPMIRSLLRLPSPALICGPLRFWYRQGV